MAAWCEWPVPDAGIRTFEVATYTIYIGGPSLEDESRLDLGIRPVVAITSVALDTNNNKLWSDTVASSERYLDPKPGHLYLNASTAEIGRASCRESGKISAEGVVTER